MQSAQETLQKHLVLKETREKREIQTERERREKKDTSENGQREKKNKRAREKAIAPMILFSLHKLVHLLESSQDILSKTSSTPQESARGTSCAWRGAHDLVGARWMSRRGLIFHKFSQIGGQVWGQIWDKVWCEILGQVLGQI